MWTLTMNNGNVVLPLVSLLPRDGGSVHTVCVCGNEKPRTLPRCSRQHSEKALPECNRPHRKLPNSSEVSVGSALGNIRKRLNLLNNLLIVCRPLVCTFSKFFFPLCQPLQRLVAFFSHVRVITTSQSKHKYETKYNETQVFQDLVPSRLALLKMRKG